MIIVSQDKDSIINFDNIEYIEIYPNSYGQFYLEASLKSIDKEIGKYKTEERAKEVLKEIVETYNIISLAKIYKMPEE